MAKILCLENGKTYDESKGEFYGPLAAVYTFDTEDQAVKAANDTEFGLSSYFFLENVNRVKRVAKLLEAGMIDVNTSKISAVWRSERIGHWERREFVRDRRVPDHQECNRWLDIIHMVDEIALCTCWIIVS